MLTIFNTLIDSKSDIIDFCIVYIYTRCTVSNVIKLIIMKKYKIKWWTEWSTGIKDVVNILRRTTEKFCDHQDSNENNSKIFESCHFHQIYLITIYFKQNLDKTPIDTRSRRLNGNSTRYPYIRAYKTFSCNFINSTKFHLFASQNVYINLPQKYWINVPLNLQNKLKLGLVWCPSLLRSIALLFMLF